MGVCVCAHGVCVCVCVWGGGGGQTGRSKSFDICKGFFLIPYSGPNIWVKTGSPRFMCFNIWVSKYDTTHEFEGFEPIPIQYSAHGSYGFH